MASIQAGWKHQGEPWLPGNPAEHQRASTWSSALGQGGKLGGVCWHEPLTADSLSPPCKQLMDPIRIGSVDQQLTEKPVKSGSICKKLHLCTHELHCSAAPETRQPDRS